MRMNMKWLIVVAAIGARRRGAGFKFNVLAVARERSMIVS